MARRQLQTAFRNQVDKSTTRGRRCLMDGSDDILILVGAGNGENFGKTSADQLGFIAHATGDDHTAIFGNSLSNRIKAFFFGTIEKAACVDEHDIRAFIIRRHGIAIGPEFGENAFAVDQRLRTAQGDHADLGRCFNFGCHDGRPHRLFCDACHHAVWGA